MPTTTADLARLAGGVKRIAATHRATFEDVTGKRSALLEYAALMLAVERYANGGYQVTAQNLHDKLFRIKKSSNGNPWSFSWFEVTRTDQTFELLTNAKVFGAHDDGGTYVVDVAVLPGGSIAAAKAAGKNFAGFANDELRTFVESKALAIYPMLLAQFVGIVLEITPRFVAPGQRRRRGHVAHGHFDPALVALGSFSANAARIVEHYPKRGYRINVVPRLDIEAAAGSLLSAAAELTPPIP